MQVQENPFALIVLDVQAIDRPNWEGKSNPGYLAVIQRLLGHWRLHGSPVIHLRQEQQLLSPG